MALALVLCSAFCAPALHAQPTARFDDLPPAAESRAHVAVNDVSEPAPAPEPVRIPAAPAPAREAHVVPNSAWAWSRNLAEHKFRRGQEFEERGDTALALREYMDALRHDSTFGPAYLRLGALREQMGDPSEADQLYTLASAVLEVRTIALVKRALLRRRIGRGQDAVEDLQAAVAADVAPEPLRTLATWYVERRSWPAALAVWRQLLVLAEHGHNAGEVTEAKLQVRALSLLAAETDPVNAATPRRAWVRRALAGIARHSTSSRGPVAAQPGERKLAP